MRTATLTLPTAVRDSMWKHLLPPYPEAEEAAFCFAYDQSCGELMYRDHYLVREKDFVYYSLYHIELTDECRAQAIKRAHDLNASIVEFHSHPYPYPAEFSGSDVSGFRQFVPHVWWRLKGGPYAAVVAAPSGFDSLLWWEDPRLPSGIVKIAAEGETWEPTSRTYSRLQSGSAYDD